MSTWNMPPGCSTNDIPGNESDDQLRAAFIESQGDAAETIAASWVDELQLEGQDSALALVQEGVKQRRESLRVQLRSILRVNLTAFERANNSGVEFETWLEENQ
jgi:hypothetical protein